MPLSPEQPSPPETSPTAGRFCQLVEDMMGKYRWGAVGVYEPQYGTNFRLNVSFGGEQVTLRSIIAETAQGTLHRLVVCGEAAELHLDFLEGQRAVRSAIREKAPGETPFSPLELDDDYLEEYMNHIDEALEQLDYDDEFWAIVDRMAQDEKAAFEAAVLADIAALGGQDDSPSN